LNCTANLDFHALELILGFHLLGENPAVRLPNTFGFDESTLAQSVARQRLEARVAIGGDDITADGEDHARASPTEVSKSAEDFDSFGLNVWFHIAS